MTPLRRFVPLAALAAQLVSVAPVSAQTKRMVAVLPFENDKSSAREVIVAQIEGQFDIIHGDQLSDACSRMNVPMEQCPAEVGAVAVIAGAVKGRKLLIAVYSGQTGDMLASGTVPLRGKLVGKSLSAAMAIVAEGLEKAPESVTKAKPEGGQEPGPASAPAGKEEDPLAVGGVPSGPVVEKKKRRGTPRIEGYLTMGVWAKSFSVTDTYKGAAPQFNSGAAFTLGFKILTRPAAFFMENPLANVYLGLRYRHTVGLETQQKDASNGSPLPTSMSEVLFEFGYDWKLVSASSSPHLLLGAGYGTTDFSIEFPMGTTATMPAAAYRFLPIQGVLQIPFTRRMGTRLGFDYRFLFNIGQLEDATWFGPASGGGLNAFGAIDVSYKGFVGSIEYAYTRYFFSFTDKWKDVHDNAAGGAVDQLHTVSFNAGYSY